jgi:hypothetical protein
MAQVAPSHFVSLAESFGIQPVGQLADAELHFALMVQHVAMSAAKVLSQDAPKHLRVVSVVTT